MPKSRTVRRSKRRFSGNQHSNSKRKEQEKIEEDATVKGRGRPSTTESKLSISSKKISDLDKPKPSELKEDVLDDLNITGFRLLDMELVSQAFSSLRCAECGNFQVTLMENHFERKGCASSLRLLCENCGWKLEFNTSKKQTKSFEVNRRLVYAMRLLGKGHSGAKRFCTLMNMPPPPTARAYAKSSRTIGKNIKKIAENSMSKAANEIRESQSVADNEIANCAVSCDGTWQRRGYSSQNGCVIAISMESGKVVDAEALSQVCKKCQLHSHLDKNSREYELWRAEHNNCKANYKGSAPAMEPEGTQRMFQRSIGKNKLRYTELFGDGDSKSFNQVKDTYREDGIEVCKKECIGHVQKRVGTALRKLKKENTGFGGKGKLTDGMIDKLQNYYGIAIRSNVDNLEGMKKAIIASLFHCIASKDRPLHDHCPEGASSWCRYNHNKANGVSNANYKHGPGLPLPIIHKVKDVYSRLSNNELLEKCLHGKTQNQNESLNGMIWQRIPKEVFVGREMLEFGMNDAISYFNMGAKTVLDLYESLKIPSGKYTLEGCRSLDADRVCAAEYKLTEVVRNRRRVLRGSKKKKEDKKQQAEGLTYAAGAF